MHSTCVRINTPTTQKQFISVSKSPFVWELFPRDHEQELSTSSQFAIAQGWASHRFIVFTHSAAETEKWGSGHLPSFAWGRMQTSTLFCFHKLTRTSFAAISAVKMHKNRQFGFQSLAFHLQTTWNLIVYAFRFASNKEHNNMQCWRCAAPFPELLTFFDISLSKGKGVPLLSYFWYAGRIYFWQKRPSQCPQSRRTWFVCPPLRRRCPTNTTKRTFLVCNSSKSKQLRAKEKSGLRVCENGLEECMYC